MAAVFIGGTMGAAAVNSTVSPPRSRGSAAQLAAQELVELRGVRLAAGSLHHLADEETEQLVLAGAILGELRRALRHNLLDRSRDGGAVGDLAQALRFDH